MSHHLMNTYAPLPVAFERGEGAWLWDTGGRRYLDAISGLGVCALGHGHPELAPPLRGFRWPPHWARTARPTPTAGWTRTTRTGIAFQPVTGTDAQPLLMLKRLPPTQNWSSKPAPFPTAWSGRHIARPSQLPEALVESPGAWPPGPPNFPLASPCPTQGLSAGPRPQPAHRRSRCRQ